MKNLGIMLLGLVAAFPLYAQDPGADASAPPPEAPPAEAAPAEATPTESAPAEATAEAPPAEAPPAEVVSTEPAPTDAAATEAAAPAEPAPAEAAPADVTATTEAPPADSTAEAPPADSTAEAPASEPTPVEAPVEEASSEPAEEESPLILYVGADYGSVTVSISNLRSFPVTDTESTIYKGRVGMRISEAIGIEAHYGKGQEDEDLPNAAQIDHYFGIYIVPTGTLLDVVEFGFPLGFAWTRISSNNEKEALDGVSYGMNMEFPIKLFVDSSPDVRLGGGGMVYQQNNSARTYGWHVGVRYDFAI
jgi:hypothetical protein